MSDRFAEGLQNPLAEQADVVDVVEQSVDVPLVEGSDDVVEPDLTDVTWETDPADALEQRLEVPLDDERDPD